MFHLSRGDWPLLQWLNLQHNKISALGIDFLTHSNWTFLTILDLDRTAVSAETWTVLSLNSDAMPEAASLGVLEDVRAERQVTQAAAGQAVLWPTMSSVKFSSCVGSPKKNYRKIWQAEHMLLC